MVAPEVEHVEWWHLTMGMLGGGTRAPATADGCGSLLASGWGFGAGAEAWPVSTILDDGHLGVACSFKREAW